MLKLTIPSPKVLALVLLAAACGSGSNDEPQPGSSGDASVNVDDASSPSVEGKDARSRERSKDGGPLGLSWKVAESGTTLGLAVVLWADDAFIAVGKGGTVLKSPDGLSWTALASGLADDLASLTWTGKLLVAATADGKILTSTNGTSWTEQGANLGKRMRQVAWTGKVLSAVGVDGYTATSSDGLTWTSREIMDLHTFVPTSAVWIGDRLIWGGYSNQTTVTFNEGMAFATKDGVWFTSISPGYQCNSIFGVAWNGSDPISGLEVEYNGKLIAVGRNGEAFTMSYGSWNSGKWGEGYISTMDLAAVVWTGAEAVAVGEGGVVLRSATGHFGTWTQVDVPRGADFTSLTWNEDRLVAVGSGGLIITSP